MTPLKFNMETENRPLEKEIPKLDTHNFSGSMLNFGGVQFVTIGCWYFNNIQLVTNFSKVSMHGIWFQCMVLKNVRFDYNPQGSNHRNWEWEAEPKYLSEEVIYTPQSSSKKVIGSLGNLLQLLLSDTSVHPGWFQI